MGSAGIRGPWTWLSSAAYLSSPVEGWSRETLCDYASGIDLLQSDHLFSSLPTHPSVPLIAWFTEEIVPPARWIFPRVWTGKHKDIARVVVTPNFDLLSKTLLNIKEPAREFSFFVEIVKEAVCQRICDVETINFKPGLFVSDNLDPLTQETKAICTRSSDTISELFFQVAFVLFRSGGNSFRAGPSFISVIRLLRLKSKSFWVTT